MTHAKSSSPARRKTLPLRDRARLVDGLPDAVIALDRDGHIAFANPAFEALLGYTRDEVEGRGLCDLLAADQSVPTTSGTVVHARHRDGRELPLEVSFDRAAQADRRLLAVVLRSAPERKNAESSADADGMRRRASLLSEAYLVLAASRGLAGLQPLAKAIASAYAGTCAIDLAGAGSGLRRGAFAEAGGEETPDDKEWAPGIAETLRTARLHVAARATAAGGGFVVHAPLAWEGNTAGVLTFITTGPIGEADLAVADELARQAARSLAETRQRFATLSGIDHGIVALGKQGAAGGPRRPPAITSF